MGIERWRGTRTALQAVAPGAHVGVCRRLPPPLCMVRLRLRHAWLLAVRPVVASRYIAPRCEAALGSVGRHARLIKRRVHSSGMAVFASGERLSGCLTQEHPSPGRWPAPQHQQRLQHAGMSTRRVARGATLMMRWAPRAHSRCLRSIYRFRWARHNRKAVPSACTELVGCPVERQIECLGLGFGKPRKQTQGVSKIGS